MPLHSVTSSPTRTRAECIDALPINAADRELARRELDRAEASVEHMLGVVSRLQLVLLSLRHAFVSRRQRLG